MTDGKEELDELREAVRDFLAAKSPESAVRAAMETERRHDPAMWEQLARQLRSTRRLRHVRISAPTVRSAAPLLRK